MEGLLSTSTASRTSRSLGTPPAPLLKAAATRLQATVGAADTVARLGGDEFTVVLEDVESLPAVERMAREILAAFAVPLEVDERHDVSITPSLGISLYPDHALVPTDLLKYADTAMYQAKAEGRNTYQIYNETMDAESRRRALVLASLRKALDRGEFHLMFQRAGAGRRPHHRPRPCCAGQAPKLATCRRPCHPLARKGLILPIGDWGSSRPATSCGAGVRRAWTTSPRRQRVGVAAAALQPARAPDAVLRETGVPANRIELEVTRAWSCRTPSRPPRAKSCARSREPGHHDFGTALVVVYLKRLPIDTLKIDRIHRDLTRDPDDEASQPPSSPWATRSAERHRRGRGTEQQLAYLREQGCDEIRASGCRRRSTRRAA